MNKNQLRLISFAFIFIAIALVSFFFIKQTSEKKVTTMIVATTIKTYPDVACKDEICTVRVAIELNGQTVFSKSLPFSAASLETKVISVNSSFGLGEIKERSIQAWSIGTEEASISVAIELIKIGENGIGVIAHQLAGFEHVKRAHIVFELKGDELKTHLELIEGAGPHYIALWPEKDGISLDRSFDGTTEQTERYQWVGSTEIWSLTRIE